MYWLFTAYQVAQARSRWRLIWSTLSKVIRKRFWHAKFCREVDCTVSIKKHDPEFRVADARCIFQHCLENRLQFAWRTRDDTKHLRCRRLPLQRLREIIGALPQLVQQARVLDGDHGLGGEILQQSNLPVGERMNFLAVDEDYANQHIVLKHWHPYSRSRVGEFCGGAGDRIGGIV